MGQPWEQFYSVDAMQFDPEKVEVQTLSALANKAVRQYGPKPAFTTILPNGAQATISYEQLGLSSDYFAVYLREVLGLKVGDTVAVLAPNCIGFCVASIGIAKAGCIGTNVNPLYTASELEHQLSDSNATAIVIIDLFADKLDQVIGNTQVKHAVSLSLLEFFPPAKRALMGFVLKYVKKVVPTFDTPHIQFSSALKQGEKLYSSVDVLAYSAAVKPQDIALYQYTSGTTGRSKGAELTHAGICLNAEQARLMTHEVLHENAETVLIALPLYHITAYTLIFMSSLKIAAHGILVPSPRPPKNLLKVVETHQITWFTGINTLFAALLVEPWFDRKLFEKIRFCGSGGAAQHSGVAQNWFDQTGVEIQQGYGMTEVCGVLTLNPCNDNRLGKVGIPVPGAEVRIIDSDGKDVEIGQPGEVIARTPSLMKGYLGNPSASDEVLVDGWYYSGDIGVFDKDGFLEIVDRKKDMILVSGFNVAPNEIEDVISTLAGVAQVGVIGIPDEKTGEAPVAFVVRADPQLTEEAVLEACRNSLTNYKMPRVVKFVDEVPITLSGKVLRRELREQYF